MGRRTVNLESLVARDAEPRIRTEKVGLYDYTTTSHPLDLPHPKPGEIIDVKDDPLPRVRRWFEDILKAIVEIRTNPSNYRESVRKNAEECSVALTKAHALLREIEQGAVPDLGTVALAIERGAELAAGWERLSVNMALEKIVTSKRKSEQNIKPPTPSVTDQQIRAVVNAGGTRATQAAKLGLTERQLYRRLAQFSRH